jgi:hypothetical protein
VVGDVVEIGAVVDVTEIVVDVVGTVVLVVVVDAGIVVVVVPNCGRVTANKGALFGQYRDGYPNWSLRSPTYSKCMPSAGQKLPPHANPHFRKIRTTAQFICGTPPSGFVAVLMSNAIPHACREGAPKFPASLL